MNSKISQSQTSPKICKSWNAWGHFESHLKAKHLSLCPWFFEIATHFHCRCGFLLVQRDLPGQYALEQVLKYVKEWWRAQKRNNYCPHHKLDHVESAARSASKPENLNHMCSNCWTSAAKACSVELETSAPLSAETVQTLTGSLDFLPTF